MTDPESATVVIPVKVSPAVKAFLDSLDIPVSQWAREAIMQRLDDEYPGWDHTRF